MLRISDGLPDYSWLAVYDGHGGSLVSRTAAREVLLKIFSTPEWKADHKSPSSIGKAIRRGFLLLDEELRRLPEVVRGDDHSGSTAISSLMTPNHIIVGNVGDSRSILIRNNEAIEMSHDHKPYLETEQRRIEAAGGTVQMRRVNGDLAVSRALGDFSYKALRDLPAESQQISAEPDVKWVERSETDQFLVLACDGIWDVMSNEEVAQFILQQSTEGGVDNLGELAEILIDTCLEKGSRDNMSVVIVAFPNAPRPTAEAKAARQKRIAALKEQQAQAAPPHSTR
jgi:protein phosphatase 1B